MGWNYRLPELCAAVALAQTERLQELVAARVQAARLYAEAARGCAWLAPQAVPDGYGHAYWTYVLKLENGGAFTWYDFRAKYRELGGDGIYAAWQLTYLEPAFRGRRFTPQAAPGGTVGRRADLRARPLPRSRIIAAQTAAVQDQLLGRVRRRTSGRCPGADDRLLRVLDQIS